MSAKPIRFLQISDIHLLADPKGALLGVTTQDSFNAVLDKVREEATRPDFIILSGDLSQDGSEASYLRVFEMLNPLQVPIYYVTGNHDEPTMLTHVFPRGNFHSDKHIVQDNWLIILLDTHKSGAVEGYLDEMQFAFLQDCLKGYPHHHAIILFHHHPMSVGTTWLENIGLTNAEAFWEVISRYDNVHTVLFGHVHQEYTGEKNGIPCYAVPSTCIQFKPNMTEFKLDCIPPGFRWVNLHSEGRLETGVTRCKHYVGAFDEKAKGY